jgi:SAM-dependent methyltransferase
MASSTKSKKKDKQRKQEKGGKKPKKKDRKLSAKTADKYDLYQRAVNSPETDVDFVTAAYEEHRCKSARHLREDFCGTAAFAAEFLRRDPANTAEGFDLDPQPVAWGRQRNFTGIEDVEARMTWHLADVRSPADKRPDITSAQNFSYWCFHTRKELLGYFKAVHADLADDGVFILDLYGGPEALNEMEELRDIDGAFTYVWDQHEYWPGTGEYRCKIHFRFKDGSELKGAFEYEWRFWHLTELRDALEEVGFAQVLPYFEGTDPDDEESGNGEFTHDPRGENCEAWIGYLVALK